MVITSKKFLVFGIFLMFGISFGLNFVVAEGANCGMFTGTTEVACIADTECAWRTQDQDAYCTSPVGCCMEKGCWMFAGTNESACVTGSESSNLSCMWDNSTVNFYPNGTVVPTSGACVMNWSGNDMGWGGPSSGCWSYDGDKASCGMNGCLWSANDQNQDPWCGIKSLTDAKNKNPLAVVGDIGCCQQSGCWAKDNDETACESAFQGNCFYQNNSYGGGWCNTKSCNEIITEVNCTYAKQTLMMPCDWNGSVCTDFGGLGGGGFSFYNDTDSCFNVGGWYNSTGGCIMPSGGDFGAGAGGFMFAGESHCWFADNKPEVCGNITGCAYCVAGSGPNGIVAGNDSNICSGKQAGLCEGRVLGGAIYDNANNSANLACSDIEVKIACNYGPLPNCKWTNSSVISGSYCEAGASSEKKSAPPAQYCEDPVSKNNYTICMQLANDYMMPCKWQNETYPVKNCTFNDNAVFGLGNMEKDFGVINSEFSCTSAGGTWQSEFYVDGAILKQDSWCEMTGMFDVSTGAGINNKINCDTSCWACEFQNNGTAWADVGVAEAACEGSVAVGGQAGGCVWINDTTGVKAFNKLGWCDYPKEMENGGAKDCNFECEGCNFMGSPVSACEGSQANDGVGCKWVNDTNNVAKGGFCVDKGKKTCNSDCFSCYDTTSCAGSSLDCNWDPTFNLCSPNGFSGEICFNGVDDDSDTMIDCGDPDCGFDNFCGGSSFGGDCFAQINEGICNQTIAFGSSNCTWINDTWNPTGWCDMPGANCWKFNDDLATCGETAGCTNDSSSMGMDSNSWCEMNITKMDSAACWSNPNEASCTDSCAWKNNTWINDGSGWCEYSPFTTCMNLNASDACNAEANCGWREDAYSMTGGWCDVACMNMDWEQANCENETLGGLCQWKNMSSTCQPSTFMMMGSSGGVGGKTGCWQYDGNQTGCVANDVTCTYKNDSFSRNNVSVSEPSGWCMDKSEYEHFGEMEIGGGIVILGDDTNNPDDPQNPLDVLPEDGVDGGIDILRFGMKVSDSGLDFGMELFDINESIVCNGYTIKGAIGEIPYVGSGNATGKYYWYLDTDGNESNGCVAAPSSGANLSGFDFMISYFSRNSSSGIVETKQLMRCSGGIWNPTNALITTSKKIGCGEIEGVMVAVSKQDLESFSEYNKTTVMRIFVSSANNSDSRTSPSDSLGPGYYTPGTVDFGFVDCSSTANAKDPKCKNFQKFGFNVFEECKNGVDDDENGLVDCLDPFCLFMPACNSGSGFEFSVDINDKTAPSVMFSKVEKLYDAAFVKIDTSEPSNLSLKFYGNDSTCKTVNITLNDSSTGYQANANFKPFHSMDLMEDNLGYPLTNGTAYYYKITVCDSSTNCAVSACSNFTTKATAEDKSFVFKIELPANYTVDIPAFNKTGYNFSETFGGVEYDVGIKTNTSVTKDMNMTIHCGDMSIGFFGMNVLSPTKIDLSGAFICNESVNLMGMNSSLKKWNTLIDDLHLGGATDYIEMTIPVAYDADNIINWTNDEGVNSSDVSAYVNCSDGGDSNTACKVPVSMGFSAYTVTAAAVAAVADVPASSGGGGGGATVNITTVNDSIVDDGVVVNEDVENGEEGTFSDIDEAEVTENIKSNYVYWIIGFLLLIAVLSWVVFLRRKRDINI
ncbi:MAG: hypothetical protein V1888_01420 [archaeon]